MSSLQFAASDPDHSVWVGASAGTGKTKVLTDRVLRLLLQGAHPSKILCLTFTNAAAAEMANRINKQLSDWTIMAETALITRLTELTAVPPDTATLGRARRLFAEVLDAPEGLNIQTIHAFCQSLMRKFPLEAGIAPHFTLIDERTTAELLAEARLRLLARASSEPDSPLKKAVSTIAWQLQEGSLNDLLREITEGRAKLEAIMAKHGGLAGVIDALYQTLGVEKAMDEATLRLQLCQEAFFNHPALQECCRALIAGSGKDVQRGEEMAAWLAESPEGRLPLLSAYIQLFLTKSDLTPRSSLANKPTLIKNPGMEETLRIEQRRLQDYIEQRKSLKTAMLTKHLLCIAQAMLEEYQHLKDGHSFLDFNDLIAISSRLLQHPAMRPWILYKLGGGIDHILVDEAQDTSPEQWQIVESICAKFFDTEEENPVNRTIFVVGDEKQSIFSFQGADPLTFNTMRQMFRGKTEAAAKSFRPISLDRSFRSTHVVLETVDRVFAAEHLRAAACCTPEAISHVAHRSGEAGMVTLWPPISPPPKENSEASWEMPVSNRTECNTQKILAELMALTIAGWLEEKRPLLAKGRPVTAGDILILVRRRNAFVGHLVTALKKHQVPVAGIDRMILTDNLAVMDMMALGNFLLLPQDDLTLATVLKTPLIALSEEEIFTLAYGREKQSLWERLKIRAEESPACLTAYTTLTALRSQAEHCSPFELYSTILEAQGGRKKLASRLGDEVGDPLDEFLSLALSYEQAHIPSLQGFLHWMETGSTEIKRDLEHGKNQVRIMTVHGSKGLQAPIVFLPDTTQVPTGRKNLLWDESLLLWPGSAANSNNYAQMLKEKSRQKEMEEYARLLYVALTRAEDELIICGWQGKKAMPEECWYNSVKAGLLGLAEEKPFVIPDALHYRLPETIPAIMLHHSCPQEAAVKAAPSVANATNTDIHIPLFLQHPAPLESYINPPLMPSTLTTALPPAQSPLVAGQEYRFQRGKLIHTLLQFLPAIPAEKQKEAVSSFLQHYGGHYSPVVREDIQEKVLALLNHPDFAPVFGNHSIAEVPIMGILEGKNGRKQKISGQIDRLVIIGNEVLIIDYKTNYTPPERLEDIPVAYVKQMAAYFALLSGIYPNKKMSCALIWTEVPLLMYLPEQLLCSHKDTAY